MIKFKDVYPEFIEFQTKIIDQILKDFPTDDWCDPNKMRVSWETIYNTLYRNFKQRILRYSVSQTHDFITNNLIENLPMFHVKQSIFLKENFNKLFNVKHLGEMNEIISTLKNKQTQSQINKSSNSSVISPHAFTDAITDMSISDITKTDGKSDAESFAENFNDSKVSSKRVAILEKLFQISDSKFKLYLKELCGTLDNFFVRFQFLNANVNENVFIEVANILKDDKNIIWEIDREKLTIIPTLADFKEDESLRGLLDNKLNLDFKNINIHDWLKNYLVSKSPNNNIEIDNDGLYVKSGGGGETYSGDNNTIKIDEKNVISAHGIYVYDPDTKKENLVTGTDLFNFFSNVETLKDTVSKQGETIDGNVTDIKTNKNNIETNKTNIDTNKTNIDTNKTNIDTNKTNITNIETTLNTNVVKNGAELTKIISSKDQNILTLTDKENKLYVQQPNFPKWNKICDTDKFNYNNNTGIITPKSKIQLSPASSYYLIYWDQIDPIGAFGQCHLFFTGLFYQSYGRYTIYFSVPFSYPYVEITRRTPTGNYFFETLRIAKNPESPYTNLQCILLEIPNSCVPVPLPPIPPSPTDFTKEDVYNFYHKSLEDDHER